ncbi:MAG: hypothetical protein P4L71_13325 [Acetobacteraceae bacterium]|nr:hypothetical protein [Acetobacteraceae bacterium]
MLDRSQAVNEKFHARRSEVGGLYRAECSGVINSQETDEREILDFHIGTTAADVKTWVEEKARGLGYAEVAWERF